MEYITLAIDWDLMASQARDINRLWKKASDADTLGAWAETYRLIESFNVERPGVTNEHLELLDLLQSVAFMRYAMIEQEKRS